MKNSKLRIKHKKSFNNRGKDQNDFALCEK